MSGVSAESLEPVKFRDILEILPSDDEGDELHTLSVTMSVKDWRRLAYQQTVAEPSSGFAKAILDAVRPQKRIENA